MAGESTPKPPRQAAALRYDPDQLAPTVVAAGRGIVAEQIVAEAAAAGVPVREAAGLAEALVRLGVGAEIPAELYTAVAEVLAWVSEVDQARGRRWSTPHTTEA